MGGFLAFKNHILLEMLKDYERPLYIHVGNVRTGINVTKFEDNCFEDYVEDKIYKVTC